MRAAISVPLDIDKGMDFARIARVMASSPMAEERGLIAEQSGLSPRVVSIVKSPVAAGQANGDTWGSELSQYDIVTSAFLDSLRNSGLFFRLLDGGMLRVPLRSKLTALTAGANAYVVGEGSAKKISRLSLETESIDPFRAASIVVVSDELLKLGVLSDPLISHELRGATVVAVDEKFVAILAAAANTAASSGSTVQAVQQDLRVALAELDLGQQSRLYFATHPDTIKSLATMTVDGGFAFSDINPVSGGTLLKTPLIPSDAIASGEFYAIDASGIAGNSDAVTIERFKHATVQMDDSPDSPATTSTTLIPLFQRNLVGIVASCWAGAKAVRANSVFKLTGVDWGSGNSP
ncbi:phage major capsid protein [Mesorhizobium kowhaii]|uniref:Phage capsid-like C-terminal domain-containing protein n=1 Tax=Mesorhizobium kowhaii TaxID=1300272 RepID=A0A2W7CI19_9HYPH|nr:phage major capsid protein [Mesorhizobium kowhaii]PZV36163.1 hypothetical protein B5V02_23440 [Mesorhizobium kowhaii]